MRVLSPRRDGLLPWSCERSFGSRRSRVATDYARCAHAKMRLLVAARSYLDTVVMISTRFHPAESSRPPGNMRKGRLSMGPLTSGTMAGTGSFRCQRCGYVLTLTSLDALGDCPGCGSRDFVRASLFHADPSSSTADAPVRQRLPESRAWLPGAREEL